MNRSEAKRWTSEFPIGDPLGGPAFGQRADFGITAGTGALIGGGLSLLGGVMGSEAAGDAANAQAQAGRDASATQLAMFNQTRSDQEPWRVAGEAGLNKLRDLLGLNDEAYTVPPGGEGKRLKLEDFRNYTRNIDLSLNPGGDTHEARAMRLYQGYLNGDPISAGAESWVPKISSDEPVQKPEGYGSLMKPFSMADYEADPGYGFRLSEGMKALERSAAARGGLLSGAALKGITRYGQDYASGEYTNAYNRYNQNQANQFNRLAGISGVGQASAQQIGAQGTQVAQGIANTQTGIGNARASGYVGQANAMNSGFSGAVNSYMQNQLLNRLMPAGGGYSSAPLIQPMVPGQYDFGAYG